MGGIDMSLHVRAARVVGLVHQALCARPGAEGLSLLLHLLRRAVLIGRILHGGADGRLLALRTALATCKEVDQGFIAIHGWSRVRECTNQSQNQAFFQ